MPLASHVSCPLAAVCPAASMHRPRRFVFNSLYAPPPRIVAGPSFPAPCSACLSYVFSHMVSLSHLSISNRLRMAQPEESTQRSPMDCCGRPDCLRPSSAAERAQPTQSDAVYRLPLRPPFTHCWGAPHQGWRRWTVMGRTGGRWGGVGGAGVAAVDQGGSSCER